MMMYNENYYYQQESPVTTDTCTDPAEGYYSYNESICKDQQQHQQQYYQGEEDWDMDLVNEEASYAQYDFDMANAVAEADYQDYYYYEDDTNEEEEAYEEEQYYDYQSDSLLSLVVGVQSYLTEQEQQQANLSTKHDSPLYSLQYKMYTYMRQRALELGVQL
ncbi:unnamed protein product [Mucor hiemalis]